LISRYFRPLFDPGSILESRNTADLTTLPGFLDKERRSIASVEEVEASGVYIFVSSFFLSHSFAHILLRPLLHHKPDIKEITDRSGTPVVSFVVVVIVVVVEEP
jgi:hypothetical protein